jgi:flagellar hook protein FlgE
MTAFGALSASVNALKAHSTAFGAIGDNIANATSDGYKPVDVTFSELVHSNVVNGVSDSRFQTFSGMAPNSRTLIHRQGDILSTKRDLDAGIIGSGFFVVNSQPDGSGETLFTRVGSFQSSPQPNGQVFLSDIDGNFLQGWPSNNNGGFNIGTGLGSLGPIRVDPGSATFAPIASTSASLTGNLNASDPTGTSFTSTIGVFDSVGATNNVDFAFTKNAALNTWDLVVSSPVGTVTAGSPATVTFDATGALIAPTTPTINIAWANPAAAASTVAVDISNISQFASLSFQQSALANGNPVGTLTSTRINGNGEIEGFFSNGRSRGIFKLPIATVRNTAALDARSGTHFAAGVGTGAITLLQADLSQIAGIVEASLEGSSVDLADQFTKMIVTQQAYNNAAQSIRAVDEMIQVAATMKN